MATHYSAEDGPYLTRVGREAVKKPNAVYLVQSPEEFSVETNEGTMTGKPGDYLAYDPISGHVWPISAEYVQMHYDFLES